MKILLLAGGSGNRLWPLSRPDFPKQFLKIEDKLSLLQKTVARFLKNYAPEDLVILTQSELKTQVQVEVGELSPLLQERVIVEPSRKNTAPAILYALKWLEENGELSDTFLVAPCDHLISPEQTFLEKVEEARAWAKKGSHITFGIFPTHPHTGYGYIECAPEKEISSVHSFIEKPSLPKAKSLLMQGDTLWNAGIFLFNTAQFFDDLKTFQPEMAAGYAHSLEEAFSTFNPLSIDYALVEHSKHLKVIPLSLSWSDVGSWDAIYDTLPKDERGNATSGNVVEVETKNCLLYGGKRLIGAAGIEDLLVIDSEDALLITKKGASDQLRLLIQKLQERGAKEVDHHPTTHRPWGAYTVLEEEEKIKIKRITVKPGGKLSLQYHHHRSEHWVVTKGRALITLGEKESELEVNESLFVPIKMPHRLANPTDEPLEIIEVQVGDYVGEDDIVRLEDIYGRLAPAQ